MRVADIANKEVVSIPAGATAGQAAAEMIRAGVGSLVLVDETRRPLAIVTDRDLTLRGLRGDVEAPWDAPVRRFASEPLITVASEQTLAAAVEKMRVRGVRRLPVIDGDGKLSGIVTLDDVLGVLTTLLRDLSAEAVAKRRHAIWRGHVRSAREELEDAYEDVRERMRSTAWYSRELLFEEIDALKDRARAAFRKLT